MGNTFKTTFTILGFEETKMKWNMFQSYLITEWILLMGNFQPSPKIFAEILNNLLKCVAEAGVGKA